MCEADKAQVQSFPEAFAVARAFLAEQAVAKKTA
jgi:methylene-tetrahydromethanopterin dehydrogenase